jgi:hypothetical protein
MSAARLFVPLNSAAFGWFSSGCKRYELRRQRAAFCPRHLSSGRRVELRRGYSGCSLWGKVGGVVEGSTINDVLTAVDYREVIPPAQSLEDAIYIATSIIGEQGPFILFEVQLDPVVPPMPVEIASIEVSR